MKTDEPEVTVPNTAGSVAGLGATLETALEAVGGLDVSTARGAAFGTVAAVTAVCPGTGRLEAGDASSTLTSGSLVAAGAASVEGAMRLAADAAALGLPTAGWARAGSFLTESEGCRGAWGGTADCCCPRSEADDAETSLLPGFSGEADDGASSVLLPEDTDRVEADVEFRKLSNGNMENDGGRGVAVVADGGADGGKVLLVCWPPKEKTGLLPPTDIPPKLTTPEAIALGSDRPPKTPVEEVLVLVLAAAAGATVVAVTEEVTGGSTCFPNTGGPVKLNPEGTVEALVGCALVRLVDEALLVGFVESSAWPTRSPEKLPRVSPAKGLGNRSSSTLDGGLSSLPEGVERALPGGATGLLPDGADSPGEATAVPVVCGAVTPEGGELSGMVS